MKAVKPSLSILMGCQCQKRIIRLGLPNPRVQRLGTQGCFPIFVKRYQHFTRLHTREASMSLVRHVETSRLRRFWHDRVTADFRDFRFTAAGFARWSITVLAALLIGAVITLYFLDWNLMRGPISRYASYRYG